MMSDPHLGIMTVQAGQRWELTRQYMELLEICERWIQLSGLCYMIIGQAIDAEHGESHYGFGKLGDDWFIWQMLIHANSEANPAELAFEAITQYSTSSADYFRDSVKVEGVIQSFCHPMMGPKERNARLALLLFYSTEVVEGRKGQDVLLTALAEFFRDFSTRVVCFLDFKPWLSCLDLAGRKQLLLDAAKIARGMRPQSGDPEVSHARSRQSA